MPRSKEDVRAEIIYKTSTKKCVDEQRWETGILRKTVKIPNNGFQAMKL